MSGAKILFITREHLTLVLRGEARIRNLPSDSEITAFLPQTLNSRCGLAMRVQSASYPSLCYGQPPPMVTAVIESLTPSQIARKLAIGGA